MFSGKEPRRTSTGRAHSSTRERLLRELEAHGGASTAQLVEITGLHENTVRGHLESLRHLFANLESIWPNAAFEEGIGVNALTSADAGYPAGGAVFHDTAVWLRAA